MKREKMKTAAQLLSELQQNPEFVAKQREREEQQRKAEQALAHAEVDLVRDLSAVGVPVTSVWNLVNSNEQYLLAIPVLLNHLDRTYPAKVREGIVRALSVPAARGVASPALISAFEQEQDAQLKWVIGNALSVVADEPSVAEIARIARNPRHGEARQMLLLALSRIGTQTARGILEELLRDDELAGLAAGVQE